MLDYLLTANRQKRVTVFCELLDSYIKSVGLSKAELCRKARISRPYLYSVLSGESKPPTYELQIRIADCLRLDDDSRAKLYDEAAQERGEIPADIIDYFQAYEHISEFRRTKLLDGGECE